MTFDEIRKLNVNTCESFSAFAHDKLPMPGLKKRLEEILNKQIVIIDFRISKSTKRENTDCLQLQFLDGDEVCILFTGSIVLLDQMQSVKDKLPFKTTIVKVDKYYSFS